MIRHCEYLVIGAGMAGLAAARTLAKFGAGLLVFEADTKIGGLAWAGMVCIWTNLSIYVAHYWLPYKKLL